MYKKILVPHAGTTAGDKALKHAIHIAKFSSAEIIILHVIEDFPHVPILAIHASQANQIKKEIANVTKQAKLIMQKVMTKKIQLCQKNNVKASLKIVTGIVYEEILKIVHNQKIDLIVMSKRRKLPGLKRVLSLGSVSRKIVESTSCPILLIDSEKK